MSFETDCLPAQLADRARRLRETFIAAALPRDQTDTVSRFLAAFQEQARRGRRLFKKEYWHPTAPDTMKRPARAELLLDIYDEAGARLSPHEPVTACYDNGLHAALDSLVLPAAFAQAAAEDIPVSVNISPHSLVEPGFLEETLSLVRAFMAKTRIDAPLVFELHEHAIPWTPDALPQITALKETGILFAQDDYGTQEQLEFRFDIYINAIKEWADIIKIDKAPLQHLRQSGETDYLEMVICLIFLLKGTYTEARKAPPHFVLEGVDTPETAQKLITAFPDMIDYVQGYRLGPPETFNPAFRRHANRPLARVA